MQTIKMMRYLGKVESKWIDPTITNPILRTMPRGETLHIPVERKNWLPEPDALVLYVCIVAYVVAQFCIFMGWMR